MASWRLTKFLMPFLTIIMILFYYFFAIIVVWCLYVCSGDWISPFLQQFVEYQVALIRLVK